MGKTIEILLKRFLRKQATPDEVEELRELFLQAKAEEQLSDFYEEAWKQADFTPEEEVKERVWAKLQQQVSETAAASKHVSLVSWRRKILRAAVVIFIPLLCGGLGYFLAKNASMQHSDVMAVEVEIGQKAKIRLPDSTFVWLNSAGSLTYDNSYNKKERVVHLQGEAYFEVSKNKTRPFIVKMNDISVEALGTKFAVKAYPSDSYIAATLIEGSIRVESPEQSALLKPDEKLTITRANGQFAKVRLPDAEKSILWINNQLAFEQERLEDIAKVLERMYNIQIIFESDELKEIRFSGTIKNSNMKNVLQSIALVSPIHYSLEKDATIVIRKK